MLAGRPGDRCGARGGGGGKRGLELEIARPIAGSGTPGQTDTRDMPGGVGSFALCRVTQMRTICFPRLPVSM